jgi:prolyl oligopeptidase
MQAALLAPHTVAEPITETLHGIQIADPYRWLEDQHSPRTREWIREQTGYARVWLDAIPGRDSLRRCIAKLLSVTVYDKPYVAGDRMFFLKREAARQQPSILMQAADGVETVLIDPSLRDAGGNVSVNMVAASTNGNLLAYGVKHGGEDSQSVEIFDVENRRFLPDGLDTGYLHTLRFDATGSGFYYCIDPVTPGRSTRRALRYHRMGTPASEDREVFGFEASTAARLVSMLSEDRILALHFVVRIGAAHEAETYLQNLTSGEPARVILQNCPSRFTPVYFGQRLFARTGEGRANGRIVEIDLRDPDPSAWRTVVPEGSTRIEQVRVIDDTIFVVDTVALAHRIRMYGFDGRDLGQLQLPEPGTVKLFQPGNESHSLYFQFNSISIPRIVYRFDTTTAELSVWRGAGIHASSLPKLTVRRTSYRSSDGTDVPLTVFHRTDLRVGPHPAILCGYGGFGTSLTPEFTVCFTILAELGCVIAIPNIRGGGELGAAWHEAGKRRNRQTAFDDFLAAAKWLIDKGVTTPPTLGIIGGSNGGLLVGAALTQRPDLFRAVVSLGPLFDMLRYHRFGRAHRWCEEYGTADDPQDFAVLYSYSPYHRVRDGVEYPAVLLVSGDEDRRCDSAHARKMTARLQHASASGLPVLLDYSETRGHSPVLSLHQRIAGLTDRLAFLCQQLGVEVPA